MPITKYICPDGIHIPVVDCLDKCRCKERCLAWPYLKFVSLQRTHKGKVSVTQGLNGTRLNYLILTKDYSIRPKSAAFTTLGTDHHALMEEFQGAEGQNGFLLETEYYFGTFDFYDKKEKVLWDFKTFKEYKVKRIKGIVSVWVDDLSGARYKKSGETKSGRKYNKGDIMQIETAVIDESKMDCTHESMQLNAYRIGLERLGYEVKEMKLQMTVKDHHARSILEEIEIVTLPKIDDEFILQHYKEKTEELNHALRTKEMPPLCSHKERWNDSGYDRRCREYCPFWDVCKSELMTDEEFLKETC